MDTNTGREALEQYLAAQRPASVHETELSMRGLMPLLKPAGLQSATEFLGSYHAVTANLSDLVDAEVTHGIKHFRQSAVLNKATPTFYPLFTENLMEPKPHWQWLTDERSLQVDGATRGMMGYTSHILGSDLALTVHQLRKTQEFSPRQIQEYLRYDYSVRIDKVLWRTAHQIAPAISDINNPKALRGLTNIFMGGVVVGRQIAAADARKMAKAKSDDEVEFIAQRLSVFTGKLIDRMLDASMEVNGWLDQNNRDNDVVLPMHSAKRQVNASRHIAQVINIGLGRKQKPLKDAA